METQIFIFKLLESWESFELNMRNVGNWEEFYNILTKYNLDGSQKHNLFVKFCRYILLYHPVLKYNFKQIQFCENRDSNKIDIVAEVGQGIIIPIVCVFKNNPSQYINLNSLPKYKNKIIITNGKIYKNTTSSDCILANEFFNCSLAQHQFIEMRNNIVEYMDIEM